MSAIRINLTEEEAERLLERLESEQPGFRALFEELADAFLDAYEQTPRRP